MKAPLCRARARGRALSQSGSAVLFALFACITVAVSIQVLALAVICCERALADEVSGRRELAAVDTALARLSGLGRVAWGSTPWTPVQGSRTSLDARLLATTEGPDWVLRAEVAQSSVPTAVVDSALLERGRDGLDLPLEAVVARCVRATEGRSTPWLETTGAESGENSEALPAYAYVESVQGAQIVGEQCSVRRLETGWSLGEGWEKAMECGAVWGPDVVLISGSEGRTIRLQREAGLGTSERPALVVITGGADLDARDMGALWAVVVADQASVLVDGTVVHGAIFASESADLGGSGQVVYDSEVLRWAVDRSFERTRLVQGTRVEGTD